MRVAYFEKERRELVSLNYAEPVRSPLAAASPERRSATAHYFAELIDAWAADADADERLFRLGRSVLDALADGRAGRCAGALLRVLAAAAAGRLSADLDLSPDAARLVDATGADAGESAVSVPRPAAWAASGNIAPCCVELELEALKRPRACAVPPLCEKEMPCNRRCRVMNELRRGLTD